MQWLRRTQGSSSASSSSVIPAAAALSVLGLCLEPHRSCCEEEAPAPQVGITSAAGNNPSEDRYAVGQLALPSGGRREGGTVLLAAAVFDGHGGAAVAEHLSSSLLPAVERRLQASAGLSSNDLGAALRAAFAEQEAELRAGLMQLAQDAAIQPQSKPRFLRALRVGACALTLLVAPELVVVANCGDCQALLVRDGVPRQLSRVHNADQPEEQRRLREAHPGEADAFVCKRREEAPTGLKWLMVRAYHGADEAMGKLSACYVKGRLQPTRSFGDFYLKEESFGNVCNRVGNTMVAQPSSPPYITSEPEVSTLERRAGDIVILASDGLWDYLCGGDVVNTLDAAGPGCSAQALSDALLAAALRKAAQAHCLTEEALRELPPGPKKRRLQDDITVLVVRL